METGRTDAAVAYRTSVARSAENDEAENVESPAQAANDFVVRRATAVSARAPVAAQPVAAAVSTEEVAAAAARPVAIEAAATRDGGLNTSRGSDAMGDRPSRAAEVEREETPELTQEERPTSADAGTEEASLHVPRGAMPAPLRGSLASLERQNEILDAEGLERIEDESDLAARVADKLLVPLPASSALMVNPDLVVNHRYCRPWTARFLTDLARAHDAVFHRPLQVNSAVRTVEYQRRLMETNGNAAPAEGDIVSPHLTGATVDIAKEGLNRAEMAWMRQRLLALEATGKIDVEEEFQQACFHITVYKTYAPARTPRTTSPTRRSTGPAHHAAPDVNAQAAAVGF